MSRVVKDSESIKWLVWWCSERYIQTNCCMKASRSLLQRTDLFAHRIIPEKRSTKKKACKKHQRSIDLRAAASRTGTLGCSYSGCHYIGGFRRDEEHAGTHSQRLALMMVPRERWGDFAIVNPLIWHGFGIALLITKGRRRLDATGVGTLDAP